MSFSNTILKFALLLSVALLYQLSGINANSIVSPKPTQTLNPGTKLVVVVKKNSTDSTDKTLAFVVGLSVYRESLGRPSLRTVEVGKGEPTWNSHESTYTFEVTYPHQRVHRPVHKTPSNVPTLELSETPVTIKQN
ncbi:hypothetical protein Pst134EA_013827 [Puccinia striiformis f. sp. tritici]|uniref:Uncharacterized protein n=1 Tax=Puccinia striiformis f. sp. tritici PST-78 TaxID=1165861 RepID=A0A0L0USK0_9BASI|nr:hypothetical protein Pst134EA_013827 [Puccinia striiformis f. sp. tritici]KAH9465973.1 hypothetical protein Pst134EA_013827 [Puccinia striiformis f. sp. tritici]KAI9604210.1 hypothetical protein H4Q26_003823 [Puccinia striiformis f. sp. tritici PST-130]KNE89906.1 hypothetical protein PSTG_16637 [Puccinia striiformis f. sp. tritici PST-78]